MISTWSEFPSPERSFKSPVRLLIKMSAKQKAYMINYSYINSQAKFLRPDLFCKQISLSLVIFGRNEGNFRKKKMFQ